MKKYTIRFHAHQYSDVSVYANGTDEANELANEKYNNGDTDNWEFENTFSEIISEEDPERINWARDYGVLAINRDSRLFEKESPNGGMKIFFHPELNEIEVANTLGRHLSGGGDYEYTLYRDGELVGYAYYED